MTDPHQKVVKEQFTRAARAFAERSKGRFDPLNVVEFSRLRPGETVIEVGGGTGNFISLFSEVAGMAVVFDLTFEMLVVARDRYVDLLLVGADGFRLPVRSRSIELVTTAQALHHIFEPVDVLKELRRVVTAEGRVLIVDSVSTESYEETEMMNRLDKVRDPSHAAFRSPSTMRMLTQAAGLKIVDEHLSPEQQTFSNWMWPEEFPEDRIEAARAFIEQHGDKTGMAFERDGDDWIFERRRLMLLCERA